MSYLGVDIGSSQVKAVAFAADGTVLASAYRRYRYRTPQPGHMELDSREVLDAALAVIRECAAATRDTDPVAAIAVSSQGEAFTPVGANGEILASSMISGDSRSTAVMAAFAEQFGRDRLYALTGHTPSGMFSLAKLLYLAQCEPGLRRRAVKFLCFEDLLLHALSGEAAMGNSLAARTMLYDINSQAWSDEILAAAGFRQAEFAAVFPAATAVGKVKSEVARELQLSPNVVLATGGHDQIIGAYGCGATEPGSAMYAAGSVECMVPVFDQKILSDELCRNNLCTYDFAVPGKYASVAYSLTGSNLYEYFMRQFAPDLGEDYAALADAMPAEPTRILAIPYFTPSGTPYFDNLTPGCVFNWRLDTSRATLFKGLEEGIALEMKLNLELLKSSKLTVDRLVATGGGFRHRPMVQLRADVLNLPIALTDIREAGCRGAASLACRAVTGAGFAPPATVDQVTPDPERAHFYQQKFVCYQQFLNLMRGSTPCLLQA